MITARPAVLAASVFVIGAIACGSGPRDDRPPEVKAAAEKTTAVKGGAENDATERAAYLGKVAVRSLESRPFLGGMNDDERMASIKGEIKNTGDRTLAEVALTIYFLDAAGKRVHEDTSHPVLAGGFSDDISTPLKPNYSRRFSWGLKVPSDWAGKVEAKVTDVRFAN